MIIGLLKEIKPNEYRVAATPAAIGQIVARGHKVLVQAGAGMGSTLLMLVVMVGVFYFMLIRPENKRKKESEEMRSSVKKGDKVTTIGGIIGTVVDVKENNVVIETSADQVRMELAKWALSSNETAAEAAKAEAQKAQEAKAKAKAAKKSGK